MWADQYQILVQGEWSLANITIQLFILVKDKLTLLEHWSKRRIGCIYALDAAFAHEIQLPSLWRPSSGRFCGFRLLFFQIQPNLDVVGYPPVDSITPCLPDAIDIFREKSELQGPL
jgi:hypothetical protein